MLETKRNSNIDILRILMMFFIVVGHVLGFGVGFNNLQGMHFYVWHFAYRITIVGVNVLILISGFVNFGKAFSLKNLLFLWLKVFLYSFGITLFFFAVKTGEVVSFKTLIISAMPTLTSLYWFFSCYLLLMLVRPLLDAIILNVTRQKLTFLLVALLFATSVISGVLFDPFVVSSGYSPIWFIVLYLCGAYFKKYSLKFNKAVLLILYAIFTILGVVVARILKSFGFGGGYAYNFPLNVVNSLLLFALFVSIKTKKESKFLTFINSATFDIYLISEHFILKALFIKGQFRFLLNYNFLTMILWVILFSLIIFVVCLLVGIIVNALLNLLKVKKLFGKLENVLREGLKKIITKIEARGKNEQSSDS